MTIAEVQNVRKLVLGFAIATGAVVFALTGSRYSSDVHEMLEWLGILAIIVCILGRTWCSLYIGGRKIVQFVSHGPYSVSRNPLYFFSIVGAFGVGAQLGSVVAGLVCAALAWMVFYVVVLQEEKLLA